MVFRPDGGGRSRGGADGSTAPLEAQGAVLRYSGPCPEFPPRRRRLSPQEAAERLKSVVPVKFVISSRTDAGVHALSNAAHLDVQRRSGQPPFSPEVLTQALNTHLKHPAIRCAPLGAPSSTAGRGGGQKGLRLDRTSWGNGTLVGRPPSGVPDLTPTGSCRPSVCTATSMPATQPHPGPTCTAWPPAAHGLTSCLCLNETDAGPCGQSECACESEWERGARPTGWPLPSDRSPGSLQLFGCGRHAGGRPTPPGDS